MASAAEEHELRTYEALLKAQLEENQRRRIGVVRHEGVTTKVATSLEEDARTARRTLNVLGLRKEITAAQVEDALNSLVKDAPNSPVNMPGSIIQQCRVVVELPRPQRTDLRPPPPSTHHGHPVAGPLPLSTQNLLMLDQQANVMGLAAVAFVTVNESWQLDLVMGPSTPSLGSTTHPGPLHNGAHPPVSQATAVAAGRHAPHANGASAPGGLSNVRAAVIAQGPPVPEPPPSTAAKPRLPTRTRVVKLPLLAANGLTITLEDTLPHPFSLGVNGDLDVCAPVINLALANLVLGSALQQGWHAKLKRTPGHTCNKAALSTQASDPAGSLSPGSDNPALLCQSSDPLPLGSNSGTSAPSPLASSGSTPAAASASTDAQDLPNHQYLSSWWSTGPINLSHIREGVQAMRGWSVGVESATVSISPWKCALSIALPPSPLHSTSGATTSCSTSQHSGASTPTSSSAGFSHVGRPNALLSRAGSAGSGTSTPSGCTTPRAPQGMPTAAGTPPAAPRQTSLLSAHSGIKHWVKLVIPFDAMRGKATVYQIPVPRPMQGVCRARYRLVLRLRYPPEVWRQLDWPLQEKELNRRMRDLEIRCASNVPSGYQQVPMSGDSNYVITGVAPCGAARVPDHTRWARGEDWTTAGEPKPGSTNIYRACAVGTCFTYALELWQPVIGRGPEWLFEVMSQCGLLSAEWRQEILQLERPRMTPSNLRPPDVEDAISQRLPFLVGYALLTLTTSGLLPWELVGAPLLDMLAAVPARAAEAALYRVFTEGIVLGESVDPVYVLYEYVQQEASSRSWDKPGARHLPREGANCSMTLRTLITPTRKVCLPPELDLCNRVLREFAAEREYFIRVAFGDERGEQLRLTTTSRDTVAAFNKYIAKRQGENRPRSRSGSRTLSHPQRWDVPKPTFPDLGDPWAKGMLTRIWEALTYGFSVLGRRYQLLAYSSNQLRSASAWFMAEFKTQLPSGEPYTWTPEGLRFWIGDLSHIKNRAKYAARLGQAFSCTYQVVVSYTPPPVVDEDMAAVEAAESAVADAPPTPLPEPASKTTSTLKDLAGTCWLPAPNGRGLSEVSNDPEPYGTAARLALSAPSCDGPRAQRLHLTRVDSVSSSAHMSLGRGGVANGFEDAGPSRSSAPPSAVGTDAAASAAHSASGVFATASAQAAWAATGAGSTATQQVLLVPEASTDAAHGDSHSPPDSPEPGSPRADEAIESWQLETPSRPAPSAPPSTSAATARCPFPSGRAWADIMDDESVAGSVMGDEEEEEEEGQGHSSRRRAASAQAGSTWSISGPAPERTPTEEGFMFIRPGSFQSIFVHARLEPPVAQPTPLHGEGSGLLSHGSYASRGSSHNGRAPSSVRTPSIAERSLPGGGAGSTGKGRSTILSITLPPSDTPADSYFRNSRVAGNLGAYRWPEAESDLRPPLESSMWIPDIEIYDEEDVQGRVKYIVTDGVGRMGMKKAWQILEEFMRVRAVRSARFPLACQVRYGGCKGMLVPWPKHSKFSDQQHGMPEDLVQIRPSMRKFESTHNAIEVCQIASFIPGFINRQIIHLLLALGVDETTSPPGRVFLDKAEQWATQMERMMVDRGAAAEMIQNMGCVESFLSATLRKALSCNVDVAEPFMFRMLRHVRDHSLSMLRSKHRIFLKDSAFLFGVIDECGVLNENQVFVQIQRGDEEPLCIEGVWMLVTKNPCLHPGDIRVLRGTYKQELAHLVNVVVFPQRVTRPHANEIAGSDLDGDQYFVCWDNQVLPLDRDADWPSLVQAADYQAAPALEEKKPIAIQDIVDLYIEYQIHDTLGLIANAHSALADQHPEGARAEECTSLALKHAEAVDYAKTCRPVPLTEDSRPKRYPHYMENMRKASYHSTTILGVIYDWARGIEKQQSSYLPGQPLKVTSPDPRLVLDHAEGFRQEVEAARPLCYQYNLELLRVINKYGCFTEEEVLTGWVVDQSGRHTRKRMDLRQQLLLEVSALRHKYRSLFEALPFPVITDEERRAAQEVKDRKLSQLAAERQAAMHAQLSASAGGSKQLGEPGAFAPEPARAVGEPEPLTCCTADLRQAAAGSASSLGASSSGSCTSVESQGSGPDIAAPYAGCCSAAAIESQPDASSWYDAAARDILFSGAAGLGAPPTDPAGGGELVDTRLVVRASAWYYCAYNPAFHPVAVKAESEALTLVLRQRKAAEQKAKAEARKAGGAGGGSGAATPSAPIGFRGHAGRGAGAAGAGGGRGGAAGRGPSSKAAALLRATQQQHHTPSLAPPGSPARGEMPGGSGADGDQEGMVDEDIVSATLPPEDDLLGGDDSEAMIAPGARGDAIARISPGALRLLSFGWLNMQTLLRGTGPLKDLDSHAAVPLL